MGQNHMYLRRIPPFLFFLSKTTSTTWYLSAGGGQSPAIKRFPFMFYDIVLLQLLASGSLLAKIIGPWRLCINM